MTMLNNRNEQAWIELKIHESMYDNSRFARSNLMPV
jgi:hypothetical protein